MDFELFRKIYVVNIANFLIMLKKSADALQKAAAAAGDLIEKQLQIKQQRLPLKFSIAHQNTQSHLHKQMEFNQKYQENSIT